ncbi:hypothetical protein LX73_0818 [Fodinibius salinus]|uniref:DUF3618 domain-containing protein n=1 Tax=Fodinibius salinus TaxID=860790 RepID=A0A5D3YSH7_9BACT|nr:hypothetical protein [Fodinibius salinus]TYP95511.1 hypothetical protein LX73_0818 [Fodinibius salinus]
MAEDKLDELEKKKQELQQELGQIQEELDNSIDQVRDNVNNKLDPKAIIQKHPLPIVGGATLIGFLLGHDSRSSAKKSSPGEFSSALVKQLKKLATRKAISYATDYVEELLEAKADKHLSSSDEEEQE